MNNLLGGMTLNSGFNLLVGVLVKVVYVLLSIMGLLIVRQVSLMNKVVNLPMGAIFRVMAWFLLGVVVLLTICVAILV